MKKENKKQEEENTTIKLSKDEAMKMAAEQFINLIEKCNISGIFYINNYGVISRFKNEFHRSIVLEEAEMQITIKEKEKENYVNSVLLDSAKSNHIKNKKEISYAN